MNSNRLPEMAWLAVIAVLVAVGAVPVLGYLGEHRIPATIALLVAIAASVVAIRRAYVPSSPTVRADVTKGVAYCIAAVLALVTVDWHPHWAIRACITAIEIAIIFDIVTIAKRPQAAGE
ncbi:MAG TPA: hypothetical protein VGN14_10800 [Candidatus Elarobacter sp.]